MLPLQELFWKMKAGGGLGWLTWADSHGFSQNLGFWIVWSFESPLPGKLSQAGWLCRSGRRDHQDDAWLSQKARRFWSIQGGDPTDGFWESVCNLQWKRNLHSLRIETNWNNLLASQLLQIPSNQTAKVGHWAVSVLRSQQPAVLVYMLNKWCVPRVPRVPRPCFVERFVTWFSSHAICLFWFLAQSRLFDPIYPEVNH